MIAEDRPSLQPPIEYIGPLWRNKRCAIYIVPGPLLPNCSSNGSFELGF